MNAKLYNIKTKAYDTCSAKNWTMCRDHPVSDGWRTISFNGMIQLDAAASIQDLSPANGSVSASDYKAYEDSNICDMGPEDLSNAIVGSTILAIDENKITLSSGKTLEIENTSDCCAWFEGDIKAFDFKDNVVTGIEQVEREGTANAPEAWTLKVLSNHRTIAEIDIEGDSSSGYYCHSVNLRIKG
jgi:hypothetical protein